MQSNLNRNATKPRRLKRVATSFAITVMLLLTVSAMNTIVGTAAASSSDASSASRAASLSASTSTGQASPGISPDAFYQSSATAHLSATDPPPLYCPVATPGTTNATVTLKNSQPYGVVFDNNDKNIYVADTGPDVVETINPSTNTVTTTTSVGTNLKGMAYDSKNDQVYVVSAGNFETPAVVYSLSNPFGALLPTDSVPTEIKYDAIKDLLYVTDVATAQVSVVNPNTMTDIADVSVGSQPWALTIDTYNGLVFVADRSGSEISIINNTSVVDTLPTPTNSEPSGIVFDPVYNYLYVSNEATNDIESFNVTGNIVSSYHSVLRVTSTAFNGPASMALDCSHNTIWVAQTGDNNVTELGLCPGTVAGGKFAVWANLKGGSEPQDLTYDSHTHAMYITDHATDTVTAYETDTLAAPPGLGCPEGAVDYGLNGNQKYSYSTTAFESVATITSLNIGTSSAAGYNNMGSLQLNVVDYGVPTTTIGGDVYWVQNVFSMAMSGATLPFGNPRTTTTCAAALCYQFTSEIFNFSARGAGITYRYGVSPTNNTLAHKCNDNGVLGHVTSAAATYYCDTQWRNGDGVTLPLQIKLLVITGIETPPSKYAGEAFISFQYWMSSGVHANRWIEYDRLDFNNTLTSHTAVTGTPGFRVSGAPLYTPSGHYNDAEIVFCGYAGSADVRYPVLQAQLYLLYLSGGVLKVVPHAYAAGADTAETTGTVYPKPTGVHTQAMTGSDSTNQLY